MFLHSFIPWTVFFRAGATPWTLVSWPSPWLCTLEFERCFLLWDSFPFPLSLSFYFTLIPSASGSPVINLICHSDPRLSSFSMALCCHLGIFHPLSPVITSGLCFSPQTAELHWSMLCTCMNWGPNKFTLTLAGHLLLGNTWTRFLKTACSSVGVPKFLHYPQLPVLPQTSQQGDFSFMGKLKAHREASSSLLSLSQIFLVFLESLSSLQSLRRVLFAF